VLAVQVQRDRLDLQEQPDLQVWLVQSDQQAQLETQADKVLKAPLDQPVLKVQWATLAPREQQEALEAWETQAVSARLDHPAPPDRPESPDRLESREQQAHLALPVRPATLAWQVQQDRLEPPQAASRP